MARRESIPELLNKPFMRLFLGYSLVAFALTQILALFPPPDGIRLPFIIFLNSMHLICLPLLELLLLIRERRLRAVFAPRKYWLFAPFYLVLSFTVVPRQYLGTAVVVSLFTVPWATLFAHWCFRMKRLGYL